MTAGSAALAQALDAVARHQHGGTPDGWFRLLFDALPTGLVMTDLKGGILAANPAFCAVTGYASDELIGRNMRLLASGRQDVIFYRRFWSALLDEGSWQGEIWNRRKNGELYPQWLAVGTVRDAQQQPLAFVASSIDISSNKQAQEELEWLALHDALTGLPNRACLMSTLEQSLTRMQRHGGHLALMLLDLDRFKQVNDTLGHLAGDRLLCMAADRLQQRLRQTDLVARLGGDEFVVLLEGSPQSDRDQARDVAGVAADLVAAMSEPFDLGGSVPAQVGASIGVSLYPQDALQSGQLLQHADAALYQAKQSGRGTHRFYTDALTRAVQERLLREQRLRRAVEAGGFALHFQPRFDLAHDPVQLRLHSVEALLRWDDPLLGLQPTTELVDLATQLGLVAPLGDWVLREACAALLRWQAEGVAPPCVTINLSAAEFARDDLPTRLSGILDRAGAVAGDTRLQPQQIELELTEMALSQVPDAVSRLAGLDQLGVRLALSNFGTGPSSLAQLGHCPFDAIRIGRLLVHEITGTGRPLAEAAVHLGHNLGWQVGAEAVETPEQHAGLRDVGCDSGQGWHYARPMTEAELLTLLRQRHAASK